MFKVFLAAFYERVFKNLKPTIIGIGVAVLAFVVEYWAAQLAGLPQGWAKIVAPIAVVIGGWLKEKAKQYPQSLPPAA